MISQMVNPAVYSEFTEGSESTFILFCTFLFCIDMLEFLANMNKK